MPLRTSGAVVLYREPHALQTLVNAKLDWGAYPGRERRIKFKMRCPCLKEGRPGHLHCCLQEPVWNDGSRKPINMPGRRMRRMRQELKAARRTPAAGSGLRNCVPLHGVQGSRVPTGTEGENGRLDRRQRPDRRPYSPKPELVTVSGTVEHTLVSPRALAEAERSRTG